MTTNSSGGATIRLLSRASRRRRVAGRWLRVFEDLSLDMARGSRLAILGPNACGKSTLLRSLLGIDPVDTGEVGLPLSPRDLLGAVLQDYRGQLTPWGSVRANLLLPCGGASDPGLPARAVLASATAFLDEVGYAIALDRPVQQLSGGQQQALVLARALAFEPAVFLWDEPTSALDFGRRARLYQALAARWAAAEITAIVVTHDLDEALVLADRVVVFDAAMRILVDVAVPGPHPRRAGFLDAPAIQRARRELRQAMMGAEPAAELAIERTA